MRSSSASLWSSSFHNRTRGTVAAATVGGDHKPRGVRVTLAAHLRPPAADGVGRERGRVVIDADAHPAGIVGDVVDAVGHRASQLRNDEVVHPHLRRRALGMPFAPGILEVADQFLLLGVHRDRRFAAGQRRLDLVVDVVELGVTIGMVRPLACLAVGLQPVAELVQEFAHQRAADLVTHVAQRAGQLAQALAGPK